MRKFFAIIDDSRHQSYIKYNLADIFIIVMCVVICGMTDTHFQLKQDIIQERAVTL